MTFEGENKILRILHSSGKMTLSQILSKSRIQAGSLNHSIRRLLHDECIKQVGEYYQITSIGVDRLRMLADNDKVMQNPYARRLSKL